MIKRVLNIKKCAGSNGYDGGAGIVESGEGTSLLAVTDAYLQLNSFSDIIESSASNLSNLPSMPGVAANGEYTNALECVNNTSTGFAAYVNAARDRARNVMKQIIIQDTGSAEFFDFYIQLVEGIYADVNAFGEDIMSLMQQDDRLMEALTEGLLLSVLDLLPASFRDGLAATIDVTGAGVTAISSGLYSALVAFMTGNASNFTEILTNASPAALAYFSKAVQRSFEVGPGAAAFLPDFLIDVLLGSVPYLFTGSGGLTSRLTGEDFLKVVVFAAISNTGIPVASTTAASIISEYCADYFTDGNGNINQDWCYAAALAIIGGAGVGAFAGGDAGSIVGAILGYGYMAIASKMEHEEYEDPKDRMANIG